MTDEFIEEGRKTDGCAAEANRLGPEAGVGAQGSRAVKLEDQIASTEQLLQEYEARALASPDDFSLELSTVSLRERLSDLKKQLGEENVPRRVRHKKIFLPFHPPG